jgi:hypothetical protein
MEIFDLWAVVLPGCYGEEGQAFGDCVKQSLACFYRESPVLQQLGLGPDCLFDLLKSCEGGLLNSACLESHPVLGLADVLDLDGEMVCWLVGHPDFMQVVSDLLDDSIRDVCDSSLSSEQILSSVLNDPAFKSDKDIDNFYHILSEQFDYVIETKSFKSNQKINPTWPKCDLTS